MQQFPRPRRHAAGRGRDLLRSGLRGAKAADAAFASCDPETGTWSGPMPRPPAFWAPRRRDAARSILSAPDRRGGGWLDGPRRGAWCRAGRRAWPRRPRARLPHAGPYGAASRWTTAGAARCSALAVPEAGRPEDGPEPDAWRRGAWTGRAGSGRRRCRPPERGRAGWRRGAADHERGAGSDDAGAQPRPPQPDRRPARPAEPRARRRRRRCGCCGGPMPPAS